MITRLARWWLARAQRRESRVATRDARTEECETCGAPADHRIVSVSTDDAALGIEGGGTGMAADFCAEHCPGGCRQGCAVGQ